MAPLLGAGVARAQTRASFDAGISYVAYRGFLPSAAFSLTPSLERAGKRWRVAGDGSWLVFESGNTSIQGEAVASLLLPPAPRVFAQFEADVGGSRYESFASFAHALARARLGLVRVGPGTAWISAAAGVSASDSAQGLLQGGAAFRVDPRLASITVSGTGTSVAGIQYGDFAAAISYGPAGQVQAPATLRAFVAFAPVAPPARHPPLFFWAPAPRDSVPYDEPGGPAGGADRLTHQEVIQALDGYHVDVIAADECLVGQLEVAYEYAARGVSADYLVASEEYIPNQGFAYDTILGPLVANPSMGGYALAKAIVDSYVAYYDGGGWQVGLSVIKLAEAPTLVGAVFDLASALEANMPAYRDCIGEGRGAAHLGWSMYGWEAFVDFPTWATTVRSCLGPDAWLGPLLPAYETVLPLRTINAYGLFAVMTTQRPEIVVEGSNDGQTWLEYSFKYKPGDLNRPPVWVEPHQPRLDWQMWFAALSNYQANPWFGRFMLRLLQGSPAVLALLDKNPFPDLPPRYVRALLYDYRFTDFATLSATGQWWQRQQIGVYCPAIALNNVISIYHTTN